MVDCYICSGHLRNFLTLIILFFSVTATSGNGDFGDWSAFNQAPSVPVAASGELFGSASQPAVELVSSSQPALGPPPAASNSSDLFDLMGSSQATMTSSQSMNFSMMSTNTVGLGLPMSRSQVSYLPPLEMVIHNFWCAVTNLMEGWHKTEKYKYVIHDCFCTLHLPCALSPGIVFWFSRARLSHPSGCPCKAKCDAFHRGGICWKFYWTNNWYLF